jgi:hypothetical protein
LTCYSWLTGISEAALVVFVRKQQPEIQYLRTFISEEQREEYGGVVAATIEQIEANLILTEGANDLAWLDEPVD